MSSNTSRILVLLALLTAIAVGALPSVAQAAACPGADPCPWTQVDTFGDVGHGEFRAPVGVATDAGGNLYVIENDTHRVQKLDPTGAYLGEWGRLGTAEGEFRWPDDIAVDAAHNAVYVADTDNHRIQKFDTDGNFVAAWGWGVDDGSAAYQVCTNGCQQGLGGSGNGQLGDVRGIATDGTHVYVADWGNKRIHKFGLDGSFVGSWTVGSPAQKPERVAVAGGKVYVTTYQGLWRFDTAGVPDNTWDGDGVTGAQGTGAGQLNYPVAIAVDGSSVYVVDTDNERIDRFDATGTFVSAWGWGVKDGASALQTCTSTCQRGSVGTGAGQFDDPYGIVVTGGKVWVADSYNHRLQQFTPAGAHVATVGNGLPGGEFYYPEDVAVAPSGDVYVADLQANRVERLSAAGAFQSMWDVPYPIGVVATDGGVYVTSASGVGRFDAAGSLLGKWGSGGALPGQLNRAWGSAADAAGNIYVADSNNNRIQKFDPSGNLLAVIGSAGSGDGQLNEPRDVAVDRAGNVYVADTGNNRVEKFDTAGAFVRTWGGAGSADGQFAAPSGIAVDGSGDVFVTDTNNNRIERFDADGHFISKWGESGAGAGQLFEPMGIAVGHSGELWVADAENNRIVRFCCPARPVSPDPADPSGTPTSPPSEPGSGPVADTVAPRIALTGRHVQRAGAVRRRGLALRIRSDEPARFRIAVTISRRAARRLGLAIPSGARRVTIGRANADLAAAGGRRLRVRPTVRARRALTRIGSRRLAVAVRSSAADRAGNRTTASLSVRITR